MLKILSEKMRTLGRGEDGVALVVTLGVFMFLYVTCASVYAVGWAVKEKLHLQAACDAAAYSAAIVQADTFSRIATINRAMSWTYQQMTRRQMDYIVWQWLEEVVEHHKLDRERAEKYAYDHNRSDTGKCTHGSRCFSRKTGWDCSDISLEGSELKGPYSESQLLAWAEAGFSSSLRASAESFYSRHATLEDLGNQIDDDLLNIYRMSEVVDDLARGLPGRVDVSARAILQANIPAYMTQGDCQYLIRQEQAPRATYFKPFSNTRHDEMIFLSYDDAEVKTPAEIFGPGIDDDDLENPGWFVRGDGWKQDGAEGIHRSYDHTREGPPLRANWTWWATGWTCGTTGGYHWRNPNGYKTDCPHSHDKCFCEQDSIGSQTYIFSVTPHVLPLGGVTYTPNWTTRGVQHQMKGRCSADSNEHAAPYGNYDNDETGRYDNRFKGHLKIHEGGRLVEKAIYARPLKLTEAYFGPAGTITVGLARRSENPWSALLGRVTGGLYSAFSPVSNSWSFCFASAKAGYKLYHEPDDWRINSYLGSKNWEWLDDAEEKLNGRVRVENGPRDYCIDWKPEQSQYMGWYYETDDEGRTVRVNVWSDISEVWLKPTWRQSWNLIQDDWDAVMVPVRQGGSSALEIDNWTTDQWEAYKYGLSRGNYNFLMDAFGTRNEPFWQGADRNFLSGLANSGDWSPLSGRDAPNASVLAGLESEGSSAWNIDRPGQGLNWSQIGDEMYH